MTKYTNLDGVSVEVDYGAQSYWSDRGYRYSIRVRDKINASELAMHMRAVGETAIVAFLPKADPHKCNYGAVLLDDGSCIHGCFHYFEDGSVSVS